MQNIAIHDLGLSDYQEVWQKMQSFTDSRDENTNDEIWLLQHPPVFTQGLAGKAEHILNAHNIPVVHTDRGGQITYHGPGQLVVYALIDLKRHALHTRSLVSKLEKSVIDVLAHFNIAANAKNEAPGVYVNNEKICSIGLRVRKQCSYHGIALNVDMDLTPFSYINPCGFSHMKMTQIKSLASTASFEEVKMKMVPEFLRNFGYNAAI